MSDVSGALYDPTLDASNFPVFAEVARELRAYHDELWHSWVPSALGLKPAAVCIQVRESSDAGYSVKDDTIYLFLIESDIEDVQLEPVRRANGMTHPSRKTRGIEWSLVRGQLLHEMMHEYQFKVVKEPSVAGELLFATTRARFAGPGHDARFYTAIATLASHFELTPEAFAQEL